MSANTNKKDKNNEDMTAQDRQSIYNKSLFFQKKNEDAVEFLKKHPIPKEYIRK
ncbi:hypothetical protein [Sphingobacterium athyrii]|uniref:hypothetical protein n=1 Tax=Sphingobacterium athyrii TaxID=2152717 RepID=UPI0015E85D44|nr:hypothetical protein [Sphingobacterium athyrii]